nr:putative ribonuclease H-like domain-containing protein [Tanacetum cinerariifolium]
MTRVAKDQGGLSQINNDDFHTYMFACFLSQEEPKRVHQALKDPSWIKAMQEELLQFKMIEAIRLFLAYASFMGFMVYQMDVKSAFLYETIEEEVYVFQPTGFEDPNYPNKVYKVVKELYGLHQAPRAWYETLANYLLENGFQRSKIDQTLFIKRQQGDILLFQIYVDDIIFGSTNKDLCKAFEKLMKDKFQMSSMGELTFFLGLQVKQKPDGIFICQDKYVAKILRKFGLTDGKSASTLIYTEKPLLNDPNGKDVDVHTYRSMTGSLMYLTSLRPNIMFTVCACACFQVTPKVSHLYAVKSIFRYLKGKPHLGLWYPNDSPFNLVAYSNSDYAGASLDRKSTTGECQFLGCRLISWQCKKQTVFATSSTEAEYVAAASCYAQMLWIQNQVLDYGLYFTAVSSKFLLFGIDCLPNEEIFTELSRMGYEKPSNKLTFYKIHLFEGMIVVHDVGEGATEVNVKDVPATGVAAGGAASVADDDVPAAVDESSIPSPTQPPPPSQDIPSTSQVQPTPPPSPIAQPPSPPQQLQPSLDTKMVKKLERRNKLEVSKLRRLKKVGTAQRIDTSSDTVMDDVSKQGRIIANIDADEDVILEDAKEVAVDAEIKENFGVDAAEDFKEKVLRD